MRRALVLGGGGITGIGWEAGVLAGLLDEGVDLREADVVIGTSAGSFVGANFASGMDWDEMIARLSRMPETEPLIQTPPAVYAGWVEAFTSGAGDFTAVGAGFGRVARQFPSPIDPEVRRAAVRGRLFAQNWPDALRVTVTDAESGELRLLGPDAGVTLEDATMASGAVPGIWPSVRFDDREWIDAGMVSPANAHLATGYDRVVVLAPMPSSGEGTPSAVDAVARLNESATAVLEIPDVAGRAAFGPNPYDPARAVAASDQGRRQGRAFAERVAAIW